MSALSPFDYLKSINETKVDLMVEPADEKAYNAFIINRGLSLFVDTIMVANEMNKYCHVESRLQYMFLINSIKKKKRFSKWPKKLADPRVEIIKQYYSYNTAQAEQVQCLFTQEQINEMKRSLDHGGR